MAHNPAGHFHHGGNFGSRIVDDDYLADVDHDHGGTADLERDYDVNGTRYEHVGTWHVDSPHFRAFLDGLHTCAARVVDIVGHDGGLVVVHRAAS